MINFLYQKWIQKRSLRHFPSLLLALIVSFVLVFIQHSRVLVPRICLLSGHAILQVYMCNFLQMEESMSKIDSSVKEEAYHAWLGYYNSISEIGRDKTMLVDLANRFSESIGLQKPPSLCRKTASKMGLKDIPGIRIRR